MDADLEEALNDLVPSEARTGDLTLDLIEAAKRAMERRRQNTRLGGAVIGGLQAQGMSWREIESQTGIPVTTARRWASPPE